MSRGAPAAARPHQESAATAGGALTTGPPPCPASSESVALVTAPYHRRLTPLSFHLASTCTTILTEKKQTQLLR